MGGGEAAWQVPATRRWRASRGSKPCARACMALMAAGKWTCMRAGEQHAGAHVHACAPGTFHTHICTYVRAHNRSGLPSRAVRCGAPLPKPRACSEARILHSARQRRHAWGLYTAHEQLPPLPHRNHLPCAMGACKVLAGRAQMSPFSAASSLPGAQPCLPTARRAAAQTVRRIGTRAGVA